MHVHYHYRTPASLHPANPNGSEIDFLIIGPDIGIVVLEVKGSYVSYKSGNFYSYVRNKGKNIKITNPFDQIIANHSAIGDLYYQKYRKTLRKHICISWGLFYQKQRLI